MREVLALVRDVGAMVVRERAAGLRVREKSPGDPVTHADELANEQLVTSLKSLFPSAGIVAEESANHVTDWRPEGLTLFLDPIDGTRDFVAGGDDFAVMVGAVERGVPTWGVVYEPAKNLMVFASPEGAFLETQDGASRIEPPPHQRLEQSVLVVSRSRSGGRIGQLVDSLGAREVRRVGGMGTKLMAVATNRAQAFVQPVGGGYAWDSAAGEAILRNLGIYITDAFGEPLSYAAAHNLRHRGVVAAAPSLHRELLARLRTSAEQMAADGYLPSWTPPRR